MASRPQTVMGPITLGQMLGVGLGNAPTATSIVLPVAGVGPGEIDVAMIYDSFSITVLAILEDLGFCKKGEGGSWVEGGRLRFDREGGPALNTDGGGLSSNHPGMRGIFLLIEAARQLRGQAGPAQVPKCEIGVAVGSGGWLSCIGAVVLGRGGAA